MLAGLANYLLFKMIQWAIYLSIALIYASTIHTRKKGIGTVLHVGIADCNKQ